MTGGLWEVTSNNSTLLDFVAVSLRAWSKEVLVKCAWSLMGLHHLLNSVDQCSQELTVPSVVPAAHAGAPRRAFVLALAAAAVVAGHKLGGSNDSNH
jgi:hypothetical protein